ncbi:MAG: PIN domain-containing protein [Candidatus Hodarchaeota archaeon]
MDANILFAALIKKSTTADLIITGNINLYAPEFLLDEFKKYEKTILNKTYRTEKEFKRFLDLLKRKITFIPYKKIIKFLDQGKKISPDPKDAIYFALALAINAKIWSNDKRLKTKQKQIEVLTTADILKWVNSYD